MSRVMIVGASGALGTHVTRQAIAAGHEVSVLVRTPSKLPVELRPRVDVHEADLMRTPVSELSAVLQRHEVVINTAGHVAEGQAFVDLVTRVVAGLESSPPERRPVCWFLAGAALLDLDERGRRGLDLPRVSSTYWPHRANFERLCHSALDWRLLCPGPMVEQPPLGVARMRISVDRVPVRVPPLVRHLPRPLVLPFFARKVPEMIVSYADAAAVMLANVAPSGPMSRRRVGLALPVGMRGEKQVRPEVVGAE